MGASLTDRASVPREGAAAMTTDREAADRLLRGCAYALVVTALGWLLFYGLLRGLLLA